jgi:hypothetical protein
VNALVLIPLVFGLLLIVRRVVYCAHVDQIMTELEQQFVEE